MFHLYGFFIALGILAAIAVAEYFKRFLNPKYQIPNTSVFDLLPWLLIPGLIGARIYHVVDYWSYYSQDLKQIFFIWQGGLGIYGGIMGGTIGVFILSWKLPTTHFKKTLSHKLSDFRITTNSSLDNRQLPFWQRLYEKVMSWRSTFFKMVIWQLPIRLNITLSLLDLITLGLPVGQAIGRFGNYFNQELYGLPTKLPWGIYIRPENRLSGWETFSKFHPLFLYEALWCIFIFLINYFLLKKRIIEQSLRKKPGFFFFNYLFLYSFGRFWLEFLRIDGWKISGLRVNQLVAVGGIVAASLFFIKYRLQFSRKFSNIHFG